MIDNINNTESTQPSAPVQKRTHRGRMVLLSVLGLVVFLGIALYSGYQSGIAIRKQVRAEIISKQIGEQFQNALVDMEFGRYEIAKQRLEWIIANDPTFPGAQEKLTDALVQINLKANYIAPTATPSQSPTPDFSGAEEAFARAQQLTAAQDWPGTLAALDQIRKLDPTYQTSLVDGMYYFTLRNQGYDLITKQGNLEGGIYHLTLAERFGPLDVNAAGVREGARYYILGASFWDLNWEQAVFYFSQVYGGWSGLWDGTMTVGERFHFASMRYGDQLFGAGKFCDAVVQYENSQKVAQLDKIAKDNYDDALFGCYPPTPTFDPALLITPTGETVVPPTEVTPVETPPVPTEPPPPAP